MARIALKIDVDTWRGTREGMPALAQWLERRGIQATFLFSLGPDHTGRALRRVFRPGFFSKVARTSVIEHYGWRTLMHGTLLPGPDIGRREVALLRSVARAGFETGIHTWDHVRWQDGVAAANEAWTSREMSAAAQRYAEIFGKSAHIHGAAGWQMNEAAYRLEADFGILLASDTRGSAPFLPVDAAGKVIGPMQLPTTLPTLDELIGRDGWDVSNVEQALLRLTQEQDVDQVYTLHAELEGQKWLPIFARLIEGWQAQGHRLTSLGELASVLDPKTLLRARVGQGQVPGRSGALAVPVCFSDLCVDKEPTIPRHRSDDVHD
jgi:peptidoglycan/xylan/chitin deacetylase (PgdA/CDA1 family)